MKNTLNFNNVSMVSVKRNDYGVHFRYISNREAMNKIINVNLSEKKWIIKSIIKMSNSNTYYKRKKKDCKKARNCYREEDGKEKTKEYYYKILRKQQRQSAKKSKK